MSFNGTAPMRGITWFQIRVRMEAAVDGSSVRPGHQCSSM